MYGNDGHKKETLKGNESRFHDIIHNVNNDGLEDMTWPGALPRHTDDRTKGREKEQTAKTAQTQTATQTQKTTQTQEKPSAPLPKPKDESRILKEERHSEKESRKHTENKSDKRSVQSIRQKPVITDEWTDFKTCLDSYDSHKEKVKRYGIYLPERVYNTYQTVFNREMSAAMSVELLRFIDRNKDNMIALISEKSELLK